jgi:cell division protein FtsI (penicillin-binding protein 3)
VSPRLSNRRIRLLLLGATVAFLCLLGRAVWLQGVQAASLERLGESQNTVTVTLPAGRGAILDHQGIPLAMGTQAETVYADPLRVHNPWATAVAAAKALDLSSDAIGKSLTDRKTRFVYIERQASPEKAARLQKLRLPGLGFYAEEKREYPQHDIASHVIGYAGVDNVGLAGLERQYDKVLAGHPGTETIVRDPTGRAVDTVNSVPPREGRNVHLALDRIMQENVQNVLDDTMAQWHAKSATGIVLDPRNGRIMAMAVSPSFASDRFSSTSPDVSRLRAVTDTYEPGSTFKIVPVSAALSEGLVTPSNSFTLPPVIHVADRTIHESDRTVTEQMSVAQIVAKSSNVGAITLAELVNQKRFYHWIRRFGFGSQTGVDFPGESAGILLPEPKWSGSSIGNLAIGQGIGVTALQMASAYAAIANTGVWIQPHFVTSVGGHKAFRPRKRRILSPHVANEMVSMLKDVVATGGTGDNARVQGYQVAGKTGTAQKPDAGGYSKTKYVSSFVGFVPATAPRLVILVSVDEPHGQIYGGTVAAPAFARIARYDLQYLGVPPDA